MRCQFGTTLTSWARRVVLGLTVLASTASGALAQTETTGWTHPLHARGVQPQRGTFSALPWESIDMASGAVTLSVPGIVIPGPNGLGIAVRHVVNLGDNMGWGVEIGGPVYVYVEPMGNQSVGASPNPAVVNDDGSMRSMFWDEESDVYMTHDYARFNKATKKLETPDGLAYYFGLEVVTNSAKLAYLTRVEDVYGNALEFDRGTGGILRAVKQSLQKEGGAPQERLVTFVSSGDTTTVTYSRNGQDEVWTYLRAASGTFARLTPPIGNPWEFVYSSDLTDPAQPRRVLTVTTPNGGTVTYVQVQHSEVIKYSPRLPRWVIETRKASGSDGLERVWAFTFESIMDASTAIVGSVLCPDGSTRRYQHFKTEPDSHYASRVFWTGLSIKNAENTTLETQAFDWYHETEPGFVGAEFHVKTADEANSDITESPYPLLLRSVTTTRGNKSYVQTFSYRSIGTECSGTQSLNDYGHPCLITDTGDFTRTTEYEYQHDFIPYIRARVRTEKVPLGSEEYVTRYEYDANGFLTKKTQGTVVTTYTPNAVGQVGVATLLNDVPGPFETSYTYDWGVAATVTTPAYVETRAIRSDGLLASLRRDARANHPNENAGLTEYWSYDIMGREIQRTPRAGAPIRTDYTTAPDHQVKRSQGASYLLNSLDGYGRVRATENAVGVRTQTNYDAQGRKASERLPYYASESSPRLTEYGYDGLERVTSVTRPDGTFTEYRYDGLTVTITEHDNGQQRSTTQYWQASGMPAVARLAAVLDAKQQWTVYTYDVLDALVAVCGPTDPGAARPTSCAAGEQGTAPRWWRYDAAHLLIAERHPESGLTTYSNTTGGLRQTRTDAAGVTTSYEYDDQHRVSKFTETGRGASFHYDVWDNRLDAVNDKVTTSYQYAGGQWLTRRTDTLPDGTAFVTDYRDFDDTGNPREIGYPSKIDRVVRFERDDEGRVSKIHEPGTGVVYAADIGYAASGAVKQYHTGSGLPHNVDPDAMDRPRAITSGPLDLGYAYRFGNVTDLTDNERPAYTQHYTYDDLDRLFTATGIWGGLTYTYKPSGDRETLTHPQGTTTYGYTSGRLSSVSGVGATFTYYPNGRLQQDDLATYTYGPGGLVEQARTAAGATVTYAYDADGLRLSKTLSGQTTFFVHGAGGELLTEFVSPTANRDYIYLAGRLLAAASGLGAPPCSVTVPDGHWKAEFFNGTTLEQTETPVMVQDHGTRAGISRNWGTGSPGSTCGLNADGFSVRWTRTMTFSPGEYEFTLRSNDGARLFINGEQVVGGWESPHDGPYGAKTKVMDGSPANLELDYFDDSGEAYVSLTWRRTGSSLGQLKGQVVIDRNGNGSLDQGEDHYLTDPAVSCTLSASHPGVVVSWAGPATGTTVPATCTANGASFSVPNLPLGTYTLKVTVPDGWRVITAEQQVTVGADEGPLYTLYVQPPQEGWAAGHILVDTNGNDVWDAGEQYLLVPGAPCGGRTLSGIQVTLGGLSAAPNQCPETPGFLFEHVPAGTYDAVLTGLPQGWWQSGPVRVVVNVGQESLPIEFRVRPPGSLSGRVLIDNNADSLLNGDDRYVTTSSNPCANSTPIDGFVVHWTASPGPGSGSATLSDCTADGARYVIPALAPGNYVLTLDVPEGWRNANPQPMTVTIRSDQPSTGSFFVRRDEGWVTGHILVDTNGNGQADPGEQYVVASGAACPGQTVSGVQVVLSGPTPAAVVPNQCWETPGFVAEHLKPGTYSVSLVGLPSEWAVVGPSQLQVYSWQDNPLEFRVRPGGDLKTRIVIDYAGNQWVDDVDQFVTVAANPCTRSIAAQGFAVTWSGQGVSGSGTPTACDSYSAFAPGSRLPAGDYSVTVTAPPGWDIVGPGTGSVRVTVPSGRPVEQNFYVRPREGWVTGHILVDTNGNGAWDSGEQYVVTSGMACPGRVVTGLAVSLSGGVTVSGAPNRCEDPPSFLIEHVPTGTYQATLTGLPLGWKVTGGGSVQVNTGQESLPVEFVVRPSGSLSGRIVIDRNGNGAFDGYDEFVTQPGTPCARSAELSGFAATWSGPASGSAAASNCAGDGAWFSGANLPAGNYAINVTYPSGWQVTGGTSTAVTIASDQRTDRYIYVKPPNCFASVSSTSWKGEYFRSSDLTGSSVMVRNDGTGSLSFTWGAGSPNVPCGVPADNFSVRWTRDVTFSYGVYRFTASSDDGVRVLLDGTPIIDAWWDHGLATYTADRTLSGTHRVQVVYYDRSWDATLKASWQFLGQPAGTLGPGQRLSANQTLRSPDGRYILIYQGDGNLVLYNAPGWALWASNTSGAPGRTEMQNDGNLVVYNSGGTAVWSSHTSGHSGAYLVVQNDGNMVVYSATNQNLWATGTVGQ